MNNEIPRREKNLYAKKDVPSLRDMTDQEYKNFVSGINSLPSEKIKGKHYDYWLPADSSNYTSKKKGERPIKAVVIHTTEGWRPPFGTFRKQDRNASTHYSVEKDGSVVYMVDEKDVAWHAGTRVNDWSVGIEVTGFAVQDGRSSHTENKDPIGLGMKQVHALAQLVANICKRNKIPIDRKHIFGHAHTGGCKKNAASSKTVTIGNPALDGEGGGSGCHYDPGNNFPWDKFIRLVQWYYYKNYIIGSAGLTLLGITSFFFAKRFQR